MKSNLYRVLMMLFTALIINNANAQCVGKWANPITDICWSCMFPFMIAGIQIDNSHGEQPSGSFTAPPVCAGMTPIGFKIGIGMDFYDPNRIVDVTRYSGRLCQYQFL